MRRVAALTRLTKDLVCSVRSSEASALPTCDWDTSAPFLGYSTLSPGAHTTFKLSGSQPFQCVPLSLTIYTYDGRIQKYSCGESEAYLLASRKAAGGEAAEYSDHDEACSGDKSSRGSKPVSDGFVIVMCLVETLPDPAQQKHVVVHRQTEEDGEEKQREPSLDLIGLLKAQ